MIEQIAIWVTAVLLVLGILIPYVIKFRKAHAVARVRMKEANEIGIGHTSSRLFRTACLIFAYIREFGPNWTIQCTEVFGCQVV